MSDGLTDGANGKLPWLRGPTPVEFASDLIAGKVTGAPPRAVDLARAYLTQAAELEALRACRNPTDADLARDAARWALALGEWSEHIVESTLEARASYLIGQRTARPIVAMDESLLTYFAGRLGQWPPGDR